MTEGAVSGRVAGEEFDGTTLPQRLERDEGMLG